MNTVTLGISDRNNANDRFVKAMQGEQSGNFISFQSPALLFKLMTLKRWDILLALTGKEPVSIREAARLVGRDVKAVHGDITALLNVGVLDRKDNKISFPYEKVHVDFVLSDVG